MSIRMFKYRLYPNKVTAHKLQWTLDRCRELYNAALTERRDAYHFHVKQHSGYHDEETRKRLTRELAVNYYQQKRDLTLIKHELREEYKGIASHVLQEWSCGWTKPSMPSFGVVPMEKNPAIPDSKPGSATIVLPILMERVGSLMGRACTSQKLAPRKSGGIASCKARSRWS